MEILLTIFKRKKPGEVWEILTLDNRVGLYCVTPSNHAKSESCTELNSPGNILTSVSAWRRQNVQCVHFFVIDE